MFFFFFVFVLENKIYLYIVIKGFFPTGAFFDTTHTHKTMAGEEEERQQIAKGSKGEQDRGLQNLGGEGNETQIDSASAQQVRGEGRRGKGREEREGKGRGGKERKRKEKKRKEKKRKEKKRKEKKEKKRRERKRQNKTR